MRLTKTNNSELLGMCGDEVCTNQFVKKCINKLAQYEDIDEDPNKLKNEIEELSTELKHIYSLLALEAYGDWGEEVLEKASEKIWQLQYEETAKTLKQTPETFLKNELKQKDKYIEELKQQLAEKDELLKNSILISNKYYAITKDHKIKEVEIIGISENFNDFYIKDHQFFIKKDFGKIIFGTREEAEEALKKLEK